MSEENDVAAWAKAHKACFGAEPLIEMRGTEKVQVGFTLELYAGLPMDKAPGHDRQEASVAVWQRLRAIVEDALGGESRNARVEIEPMRAAAVLRPENEMKPEVTLRARVFHKDATFQAVTPDERESLQAFEKKLTAMGLKPGRW